MKQQYQGCVWKRIFFNKRTNEQNSIVSIKYNSMNTTRFCSFVIKPAIYLIYVSILLIPIFLYPLFRRGDNHRTLTLTFALIWLRWLNLRNCLKFILSCHWGLCRHLYDIYSVIMEPHNSIINIKNLLDKSSQFLRQINLNSFLDVIYIRIFQIHGLNSSPWNGFISNSSIRVARSDFNERCLFTRAFADLSNGTVVFTSKLIERYTR